MPAEANRKVVVRVKVGSLEVSSLEGKILGSPWVLLSTEQQSQAGVVFLDETDLLRPQISEGSELEVEVIVTGASPQREYKRNIFKGVVDQISRLLPHGCEVFAIDMSQRLGDVSPSVHSTNSAQEETSPAQGLDQVLALIDNPQTKKILGGETASRLKSAVKGALGSALARPIGGLLGDQGYKALASSANAILRGGGKVEQGLADIAQKAGAALGDAAKNQVNGDMSRLASSVTEAVKKLSDDALPAIKKQIEQGVSVATGVLKGVASTPGTKMLTGDVERTLGNIAQKAGAVLGKGLQKSLNAELKRTIDTITGPMGNLLGDFGKIKIQSALEQGLKATLGAVKGITGTQNINSPTPTQGVAAAAGTNNLRFERNSSAAPVKSGEIDLSRSKLRAGSDRALLEGDQLIARGSTIRQVAPGQGGSTGIVLDYRTMRHAFRGNPRFTHHPDVNKGSLEVRGWSMAQKATISYKVEREEPGPETVLIGVHNPVTVAEAKHYATKLDAKQRSRKYEYNGAIDLVTLPEILELDAQKNFTIKNVGGEFDGDGWVCDEVLFEPLIATATIKAFKP